MRNMRQRGTPFLIDIFRRSVSDDLRGEVIVPPSKKLEDLIHLTELCVDLLQQNEEHYAEVREKRKIIASLTIIICHTPRKITSSCYLG